ncbi:FAD:protein FMN transferase [Sulfuricystis multivorans]|uniref:FAD:protein FMN transferase n=1 Tax=Sulfuricystis multivorans TaxID=2211108 RepID=UPI000F847CA6|nr:FAD:protein FMN transferase [Sulfuricystis multivorans]
MRLWFAGLLALLLVACGPRAPIGQEAYVFGTRVEVLVSGVGEAEAHAALGEVLREFDRLHRAYHAWQPSELTALNDAIAAGRPHRVSLELAELIRTAQALAAQGDYLFDPGIGRIIALWGFQSDEFKPVLPDATALQQLTAAKPSIADLAVADDGTVTSKNPAVALDFGGYLKGVALDRAAAILKRRGIHDALINIGGNVLALGSKNGVPWRVGIRHPRVELAGEGVIATLELHDGEAIGTSGDYQRFFELDGKRYCHLIDPRTGVPAQGTQSLTVLIPPGPQAGMRSDVLTKPLFIANDRWRELARRLDAAQVLRVDGEGRVYVTPMMQNRLQFTMDNLTIGVVQ